MYDPTASMPNLPRPPPTRIASSRWHDGDTMLIFASLVAICGTLILLKVLNPDNWVYLPEISPRVVVDAAKGCELITPSTYDSFRFR